jgi:hypothetical protein
MKVTIEVSEKNECTAAPYWLILDPKQNMDCDVHWLASQIAGTFFSREEAQVELDNTRYNYSKRAVVFCMSGHYSKQYAVGCKRGKEESEGLENQKQNNRSIWDFIIRRKWRS